MPGSGKSSGNKKDDDAPDLSKWQKATRRGMVWEREELLEVIYWLRSIAGILCGLACGIYPLTGTWGLMAFFGVNFAGFFLYYTRYLGIDDEDFGRFDIGTEGFLQALGSFMVLWIISFTLAHAS